MLVQVGKTKITKAAVLHWMRVISPDAHEVPLPPEYRQCIIHLHEKESIDAGGEGTSARGLKRVCEQRYETLLRTAMTVLLSDARLIEEAARDGIKLDRGALEGELRATAAQVAQHPGGLQAYLKSTGRTLADLKLELRAGQLSDRIYQLAEAKIPKLTSALVRRLYAEHKSQFAIPAERDLYIVHTKSKAAALGAKRQIEAGRSFASVAASLKVPQPYGAKQGLVKSLKKATYSEPVLANAIFAASPGVLSGPVYVKLNPTFVAGGYYVFKVKRKIPAHEMTFAEAAAIIKKDAPEALHKKTIAAFVAAYKARWRAATDCKAGVVVAECKQAPVRSEEAADRYVL